MTDLVQISRFMHAYSLWSKCAALLDELVVYSVGHGAYHSKHMVGVTAGVVHFKGAQ